MFAGTATFGAGEADETVLTAAEVDVFIAKYDRNGHLLWVKQAGGTSGSGAGHGIAIDGRGDSDVTGAFSGTFGAGEPNETVLTEIDGGFIAKYDRNGQLLWATQIGGIADSATAPGGQGIAIDGRGDSYVTGGFRRETGLRQIEAFVAKYDRNGQFLWATQVTPGRADTSSCCAGGGIAVDGPGNSYVTGFFVGTATFGAGEANETELDAGGVEDVFVAKYGSRHGAVAHR
jgi:hypothetical protein